MSRRLSPVFGLVAPKTAEDVDHTEAKSRFLRVNARSNTGTSGDFIVLSYDPSAWIGEHYFSVTKDVAGHEMVKMMGDFVTKVFEGPYKNAPKWESEPEVFVKGKGKQVKKTYFFYTTCPKCARFYGKNYVIGVSEVE